MSDKLRGAGGMVSTLEMPRPARGDSPAGLAPGVLLGDGRYRVVRLVGSGGMGTSTSPATKSWARRSR